MNYFYEAVDEAGKTVMGRMDAVNEADVQDKLMRLGYRPQAIAPTANPVAAPPAQRNLTVAGTAPTTAPVIARNAPMATLNGTNGTNRVGAITLSGNAAKLATKTGRHKAVTKLPAQTTNTPAGSNLGGVSTRDLMLFFQQMTSLSSSGVNLYAALEDLGKRTRNPNLAKTIQEMAEAAREGERISGVMEQYPRIYPEHIVGTVRAGELGGFLDIALGEIAHNYEQNIALYRGSWIPKLMATQAFFILPFAIPLFTSFFSSGVDITVGGFLTRYLSQVGFIYLPISLGIYGLAKLAGRRLQLPQHRYLRDSWSLKLPPFGDLQRQAALSAFIRMLRRLYHSGVAPIHAWEAAMYTATNVVIRDKLAQSYALMQQGASLPDAFTATGLFTDSVESLIVTGHQSGEVVESLDKIADYYQERVDEAAGKSKFMMLRLGFLAMLIFGGGAFLWLVHTYFSGMFHWVDTNFGDSP